MSCSRPRAEAAERARGSKRDSSRMIERRSRGAPAWGAGRRANSSSEERGVRHLHHSAGDRSTRPAPSRGRRGWSSASPSASFAPSDGGASRTTSVWKPRAASASPEASSAWTCAARSACSILTAAATAGSASRWPAKEAEPEGRSPPGPPTERVPAAPVALGAGIVAQELGAARGVKEEDGLLLGIDAGRGPAQVDLLGLLVALLAEARAADREHEVVAAGGKQRQRRLQDLHRAVVAAVAARGLAHQHAVRGRQLLQDAGAVHGLRHPLRGVVADP